MLATEIESVQRSEVSEVADEGIESLDFAASLAVIEGLDDRHAVGTEGDALPAPLRTPRLGGECECEHFEERHGASAFRPERPIVLLDCPGAVEPLLAEYGAVAGFAGVHEQFDERSF